MKKRKILVLSFLLLSSVSIFTSLNVKEVRAASLTEDEITKLSEALNIFETSTPYDLGRNEYKVFNSRNENFGKLFLTVYDPSGSSESSSGKTSSEFAKDYSEKIAVDISGSVGAGGGVTPPVAEVNANIDNMFETSKSIENANEEYYDLCSHYRISKVATVDWLAYDLDEYFSESFVSRYQGISNVEEAMDFLDKYGTHVFQQYYLGGRIDISRHISTKKTIENVLSNGQTEKSVSAMVNKGISASASGSQGYTFSTHLASETNVTSDELHMTYYGGEYLNGLTYEDLFTYNAQMYDSGYVYREWLNSIDNGNKLSIIDAKSPIYLGDILKNTSFFNPNISSLLDQAFLIKNYETYFKKCCELNKDSEYLKNIKYTAGIADEIVNLNVEDNNIKLPENTVVEFSLGDYIADNFDSSEYAIYLDDDYSFARLTDGKLIIDQNTLGKNIKLNVSLYGKPVYTLNISIEKGKMDYGYGTKTQPYLIYDINGWNDILSTSEYYESEFYYSVVKDIDLKGQRLNVGGENFKGSFNGHLDGNNHKIYNGSIIASSLISNIGMFGINNGSIDNLILDGIKVLNNDYIEVTNNGEVNVGILVGTNNGTIRNVQIINSSIRIASKLNDTSTLNIGSIAGKNNNSIEFSGVSKNNIYALGFNGEGPINAAGICGKMNDSFISNTYVRGTKININNTKETNNYSLGNLVGSIYSSSTEKHSKIIESIVYMNDMNLSGDNVGLIAGTMANNSVIENCYFENVFNYAVDNTYAAGCTQVSSITLSSINNSSITNNWISDDSDDFNGKPILKLHK